MQCDFATQIFVQLESNWLRDVWGSFQLPSTLINRNSTLVTWLPQVSKGKQSIWRNFNLMSTKIKKIGTELNFSVMINYGATETKFSVH